MAKVHPGRYTVGFRTMAMPPAFRLGRKLGKSSDLAHHVGVGLPVPGTDAMAFGISPIDRTGVR